MTVQEINNNLKPTGTEDNIDNYMSEIRAFPRLTPEEELNLARRSADGDEKAIIEMVNSNLRLVVSVAREFAGRGVPLMDLIQEGSIGLLVAARKFDYTLGCRFSTYATKWIRQGVTRCILNHGRMIRIPIHTAEKMQHLLTLKTKMQQENSTEPTAAELSEAANMPVEKVTELLGLLPDVTSFDIPVGEQEDASLIALQEDLETLQPEEELIRQELERTMEGLLEQLNDRQRTVLRLHFGLEDGRCCSLDEIGKMLGISKERARQIEKQAMDKLMVMGTSMGLEDFLE